MTSSTPEEERSIIPCNESKTEEFRNIRCPSCSRTIQIVNQKTGIRNMPGLPAGVKFDPNDKEILQHLEAKAISDTNPLIDEFIPTIEGENGICYTHPEKLPGVGKDGQIRHFFHRPSKAYTTGTRKRRKVHSDTENGDGGETRWHKTGKTRPISSNGIVKGYKKILVLYTNYGRQRKPEKTNWVMHQYHLGGNEEEKDGELVVSKVFYQTQPRQSSSSSLTNKAHQESKCLSTTINAPNNTNYYVEYYDDPPPSFISYNLGSHGKDSTPQLIPSLVLHGDGTPFFELPSNASKAK